MGRKPTYTAEEARAKHAERMREYQRRNKEKALMRAKEYYQKNKADILRKSKEKREKTKADLIRLQNIVGQIET